MLPAFNSVETVLRERECTSPGGRPGVDQAHFDQVEPFLCASEPAARLVHEEMGSGNIGQLVVVAKLPSQPLDEDRIELDAGDIREAEIMCREHVAPTAHTDHRRTAMVADGVGEIRHVVFQEPERREVSVEAIHGGGGSAVYSHAHLRRLDRWRLRRWPRDLWAGEPRG